MLKELKINQLLLIEKTELTLQKGWLALTGESGAGKSILLGALQLIMGSKGQGAKVRPGAEKAIVEAEFQMKFISKELQDIFKKYDIDVEDNTLEIYRDITSSGRGKCRVNGLPVPVTALVEMGEHLIQFHGQSEQLLLRDKKHQESLLDNWGSHGKLLNAYLKNFIIWKSAQKKLNEFESKRSELESQRDFLEFQFKELESAELKEDEEKDLEEKLSSASAIQKKAEFQKEVDHALFNRGGAIESIATLRKKIEMESNMSSHEQLLNSLLEAEAQLENFGSIFNQSETESELTTFEIEQFNSRLSKIQQLKRKYRTDFEGLIELHKTRKEELEALNLGDDLSQDLYNILKSHQDTLLADSMALHQKRIETAQKLDTEISLRLNKLGMVGAIFKTSVSSILHTKYLGAEITDEVISKQLCQNGSDIIEFTLSANKGLSPKPLKTAVSGGELSRVMLALKSSMAHKDNSPLMIFDEIDSGISGDTAHAVADCLQELASNHQILTITHLHQVASRANSHIYIEKEHQGELTLSKAFVLDKRARISELARMMGGKNNAAALEHAEQLLQGATS